MHKTLERKGQKWELYDGEQYKDCNVAVVFGSTKKHTGKLWKIRNVSHKIKNDIDWEPKFNLLNGLKNSFENDFKFKVNDKVDTSIDDQLFKS